MNAAERIPAAEATLAYHFSDSRLLLCALTHPSAVPKQHRERSYERLEFLGDSVLGAVVAAELYARFPDLNEGDLTQIKISLVSGSSLAELSREMGLFDLLVLGDSEKGCEERGKASALENVFESVCGAIFLDGGFEAARDFILAHLGPRISKDHIHPAQNPKSLLQEICQRQKGAAPSYVLVDERGPAHSPTFVSAVYVDGAELGQGTGSSKKASEVAAAEYALAALNTVEGQKAPTGTQISQAPEASSCPQKPQAPEA